LREKFRGATECKNFFHHYDPRMIDALLNEDKVNEIVELIKKDHTNVRRLTSKPNFIGFISNGSSVDMGATASLPFLEGKCSIMSIMGLKANMPVVLSEKDPTKFAKLVELIAPTFGCIVMDLVKAPGCFEIEKSITKTLPCPLINNDQHGTAIMVVAAIINGIKTMNEKKPAELKVVINGCAAAGYGVTQLLLKYGIKFIVVCDSHGSLYRNRLENMNDQKIEIANMTNYDDEKGPLEDLLKSAHVYVGVTGGEPQKPDFYKMSNDHMLFFLEKPKPAMTYQEAAELDANMTCTSSPEYPNCVNNIMALGGILRAMTDGGVKTLNLDMKLAAAKAVAKMISDEQLAKVRLLPDPLNKEMVAQVAGAIVNEARKSGMETSDFIEGEEQDIVNYFRAANSGYDYIKEKYFDRVAKLLAMSPNK